MGTYQVTDWNVQVSRFDLIGHEPNEDLSSSFQFYGTDRATNQEVGGASPHLHDERWSDLDGRVEWREHRLLR